MDKPQQGVFVMARNQRQLFFLLVILYYLVALLDIPQHRVFLDPASRHQRQLIEQPKTRFLSDPIVLDFSQMNYLINWIYDIPRPCLCSASLPRHPGTEGSSVNSLSSPRGPQRCSTPLSTHSLAHYVHAGVNQAKSLLFCSFSIPSPLDMIHFFFLLLFLYSSTFTIVLDAVFFSIIDCFLQISVPFTFFFSLPKLTVSLAITPFLSCSFPFTFSFLLFFSSALHFLR